MVHQLKKGKNENIKEAGDSRYIYQNELGKTCFQHNMAYRDFKDFHRTTAADKELRNKASNINENLKYDGYKLGLASMVYKFFDKKLLVEQLKMKLYLIRN